MEHRLPEAAEEEQRRPASPQEANATASTSISSPFECRSSRTGVAELLNKIHGMRHAKNQTLPDLRQIPQATIVIFQVQDKVDLSRTPGSRCP